MKYLNPFHCVALACGLVQSVAIAQDTVPTLPASAIEPLGATNKNRVSLGYRGGWNMPVTFKNLGGYTAMDPVANPTNPRRTPDGLVYNYDNGYVYADDYQDVHPGLTWNYGYVDGTPQFPGATPNRFDLFRSSSPANLASRDNDADPQSGMEMTYARQLGRVGKGFWGLEAGLGFMNVKVTDHRPLAGDVNRASTFFRAGPNAVLPPELQGSAGGPAPDDQTGWPLVRMDSVGSGSQLFEDAAQVSGERDFHARFFSIRVGPYLDMPMDERWMFTMGAGVALNRIYSEFSYTENVSLDPAVTLVQLPMAVSQGSDTRHEWVVGGYVGGTFSYAINERFRLFAGAQVQFSGDYEHEVGGRKAILDLGSAIMVTLGGSVSF
jgi:hypothetical protein